MGNASARGTFEDRKQQAIDEGRWQRKCSCGQHNPKVTVRPSGKLIYKCCGKEVPKAQAPQEARP